MEQTGKRKEILWLYVRILVWIAALVALFSMAANLPVLAADSAKEETDINEEDFIIKDGVLIKYQGKEKCVKIPEGVTEIGRNVITWLSIVEEVIIPEGVTKIEREAFWDCEALSKIQIPSTVTDPGDRMTYMGTSWLETQLAALPEDSPFLIINDVLVATRTDLKTAVTVPDEVVRIARRAFYGARFTSVTISDSVTEIGAGAFHFCTDLETVYMPDSVQVLGSDTFYNCVALKKVRFSDSITYLEAPFEKCKQLEEVELPANLENIVGGLFLNCKKMKKLIVHDKLRYDRAVCLPNGLDITMKHVSPKLVIYVDKGSPAEKYLCSLKGDKKVTYAYNEKSADSSDSSAYRTYTVKKGDSLWKIARKYLGAGSRYSEIVTLNKLKKETIWAGQKLKIPKK